MSVSGVSVTVAEENCGLPRWTAEMRLPGNHAFTGSSANTSYLFPISQYSEHVDTVVLRFIAEDAAREIAA